MIKGVSSVKKMDKNEDSMSAKQNTSFKIITIK